MTYREFLAPSDAEWLDCFGLEPERTVQTDTARYFRLKTVSGDSLLLSHDFLQHSVRYQWEREGQVIVEVFREGATLLRLKPGRTESFITIDFEVDGLAGRTTIRVLPEISITDKLLFT